MMSKLFSENSKAPDETIIKLSLFNLLFQILSIIFFLIILIMYYSRIPKLILTLGIFFLLFMIINRILLYRKESNNIQLKISNKGITLKDNTYISWGQIKKTEIRNQNIYSNEIINDEFLIIKTNNNEFEVYLNELNIGTQELNYLLEVYQNRFNAKK